MHRRFVLLIVASLAACQPIRPRPTTLNPQSPTATPTPTPSVSPTLTPTSSPSPSPPPRPTPTAPQGPRLAPPRTPTDDPATGHIRGHLFFPSQFVPPLAVYAVAADGSRFYRVDTQVVPPGEPNYEIPVVEPGIYYVYGYPTDKRGALGGAYTYLAACEAGHLSPRPDDCWQDPQHDLAPVEVQAGQAVEEINVFDWYGPPLPSPPQDTGGWPTYTNAQLAYSMRYPPYWEVLSEQQGETTFGLQGEPLASVRVTNGDPEELADQLIASLPPGEVVSREWLPFAGHEGLHLALELPQGRLAWWYVRRYELVYILRAATDSGLGSFDQMLQTFTFEEQ
jgi:hypothetical protein